MKRWGLILIAVFAVVMLAAPVWAEGDNPLAAVLERVSKLEARVATLEADGYLKTTKSDVGSVTKDGITVKMLSVTAGPHGTIVAVRIQNDGTKVLQYSKGLSVLVAGAKQMTDPIYKVSFTDWDIQPKAYKDYIMVFDPLPAGTQAIRFTPSLMWKGDFLTDIDITVEGKL